MDLVVPAAPGETHGTPPTPTSGIPASADGGSSTIVRRRRRRQPLEPRLRTSKACDACRVRRIKCSGPPPCTACIDLGVGDKCSVRVKARPQRALPTKLVQLYEENGDNELTGGDEGNADSVAVVIGSDTGANEDSTVVDDIPPRPLPTPLPRHVELGRITPADSPFIQSSPLSCLRGGRATPLDDVEDMLASWSVSKDIPLSQLVFKTHTRLTGTAGTPLPPVPDLFAFEDALFQVFLTSHEFTQLDHLQTAESSVYVSLYQRYRVMAQTLTDDQTAIVYAVLCVARFGQIRAAINSGSPIESSREDITYYHMACAALQRWGRPSLSAVRALFCLNTVTIGIGGPAETKDIMRQLGWHIQELGLNRQFTADLYPAQEQVGLIYSTFFYTDLFRASLTDLEPCIPLCESDVDPTPPTSMTLSKGLSRCSYFTARFLADYADDAVNVTALDYIVGSESQWAPHLRQLRLDGTDAPREVAWAEFRYNWLRILLYIPLLLAATHNVPPPHSALAYSAITRSVSQILYTYVDLATCQQLNPSWPQVQRLVVCGQLLVLCHEAGELQSRESRTLFVMLVDMLRRHEDTWSMCGQLAQGFTAAAQAFGIALPSPATVAPIDDSGIDIPPLETFLWTDLGLDFDFSSIPL